MKAWRSVRGDDWDNLGIIGDGGSILLPLLNYTLHEDDDNDPR